MAAYYRLKEERIKTMTIRSFNEAKPGSAWDTWRKAGIEWASQTNATSKSAMLMAATSFAHEGDCAGLRKDARKRAFIEGAASIISADRIKR